MSRPISLPSLHARWPKTALRHVLCVIAAELGSIGGEPPVTLAGQPTWQLFAGTELAVPIDDAYHPLVGLTHEQARVRRGEEIVILIAGELERIQVRPQLKLSSNLAEIQQLRGIPALSRTSPAGRSRSVRDMLVLREAELTQSEAEATRFEQESRQQQAGGDPVSLALTSESELSDAADVADFMQQQAEEVLGAAGNRDSALVDALDVSCRMSTPTPLAGAWAAWLCTVRDPVTPYRTKTLLRLRTLPELGPRLHTIRDRLEGFPAGFELVDLKLALFDGNGEWATNLSERRFVLAADQAREYLITEYITDHRDTTCPPTPMTPLARLWPSDIPAGVPPDQPAQLTVDASGRVQDVRLPPSATEQDAAAITRFWQRVPFFPALLEGRPTQGELTLRPADLLQPPAP